MIASPCIEALGVRDCWLGWRLATWSHLHGGRRVEASLGRVLPGAMRELLKGRHAGLGIAIETLGPRRNFPGWSWRMTDRGVPIRFPDQTLPRLHEDEVSVGAARRAADVTPSACVKRLPGFSLSKGAGDGSPIWRHWPVAFQPTTRAAARIGELLEHSERRTGFVSEELFWGIMQVPMTRRALNTVIAGSGVAILSARSAPAAPQRRAPFGVMAQLAPPVEPAPTLLSAPVELAGDWGHMVQRAAHLVVERMRHACLDGVRLVSDRQPTRLRVDEHTSGPPAVWLHADGSSMAWIIVDIGERDWSKLAYQFGHELGHVMTNSWQPHAKPAAPCQWIEEALVEAFSIRGLGRLAESWQQNPPFPGDNAFGNAIADYRQNIIREYTALADRQGLSQSTTEWFARHRGEIEKPGLNPFAQAASLKVLAEYERAPSCVEALGALNRWPGRTSLSANDFFRQWEASCAELAASPLLTQRLREMLAVG